MSDAAALESLSRGFRDHYLTYDELTAQVKGWAEAFPKLVRVTSLATTAEGREMWLLTIGPDPDRVRPSAWVDGNMHASELCGSSVALAIAEDVIRLHLDPSVDVAKLAPVARAATGDVLFYVLPRMSPDGAECVLQTGRWLRSVPRDTRPNQHHPRWIVGDVDGDDRVQVMRVADPTGEFVESTEVANLMLPRRIEDDGPYYKIYPEGTIENYDGHHVPNTSYLSDNPTDLNRNFPFMWAPEHKQMGAGSHPMSATESRVVVEFATAHPELFLWLNLHTFGGVFIRPLGDKPDTKMDRGDVALYRQLGAWAEELTGYPMVSGFEEFTYEPDTPIYGDLSEYAYHQRGCVAYVVELWDLFAQAGLEKKKKFVDNYSHLTRDDLIKLAKWDAEHNQGRAVTAWRKCEHPQLGDVEVGGISPIFGLWNPPEDRLAEVCEAHSAHLLRVASLRPQLSVEARVVPGDGAATTTEIVIENRGYLPTHVLDSAKKLDFNEPLYLDIEADGPTLLDSGQAHREVGHLDGWGRGMFEASESIYFQRSRGTTGRKVVTVATTGTGALRVRVGSCRTGYVSKVIEIG